MERLIRFWTLVYYCMYQLQIGIHRLLGLLNPVAYFLKIPAVKKSFERKRGIDDISDYIDKAVFNNSKTGVPITWAGIHAGMLFGTTEFLCFNIIQIILKKNFLNDIFDNETHGIILILGLLSTIGALDYFVLSRNKRYLIYFKEFDNIPRNRIKLYCFICLIVYLSMIVLTIISFTWFRYS